MDVFLPAPGEEPELLRFTQVCVAFPESRLCVCLFKTDTFFYSSHSVEHSVINAFLSKVVEGGLKKLQDAQCVSVDDSNDTVTALTLGKVASFYYLKYPTVALFAQSMSVKNSTKELLEILTGAAEYDELPVRHNEDLLNAELANLVVRKGGFQVDTRRLDDPHVKANLLFQAHWLRIQLPRYGLSSYPNLGTHCLPILVLTKGELPLPITTTVRLDYGRLFTHTYPSYTWPETLTLCFIHRKRRFRDGRERRA